MEIELFVPCFVDQLYPETAFNAIKVLEHFGCKVNYNPQQTCCGQPAFNAGFWNDAKIVAEKFIKDFNGQKPVVVLSSSCAGMVRNYYADLFHNSALHNQYNKLKANAFEFSEFLVKVLNVKTINATFEAKVTYHDACSALRECGIKQEPRALLQQVKGLELLELPNNETCCGFGGTFAVKYEPISTGMAEQKVQHALSTGAEYIVSADLSCLMHMEGYIRKHNLPLKTIHIADILVNGVTETVA